MLGRMRFTACSSGQLTQKLFLSFAILNMSLLLMFHPGSFGRFGPVRRVQGPEVWSAGPNAFMLSNSGRIPGILGVRFLNSHFLT